MTLSRCLVTGASGFVGSALCRSLLRKAHPVRAVVRSEAVSLAGIERTQVVALSGNSDCSNILAGVDTVFHLASRVHQMHDASTDSAALYRQANVDATLHLARQSAQAGVTRFVFVSTAKVHGEETAPGRPWTESDVPSPRDPYAQSKLDAEFQLRTLVAQIGMELVIVRPPLVYGPGAKANFAALERAVLRGLPLPLAAIHNKRSLVALGNLVDFLQLCGTHPAASGQTFLVSDGHDISTPDLVRAMAQAAGVASRLLWCPESLLRAGGALLGKGAVVARLCGNLQLNISKAQTQLGWRAPLSVVEGMRQTLVEEGLK